MNKVIVFHCPQDTHILLGCPSDLVRYEATCDTVMQAIILIHRLENRYAYKNSSGYPASVYKYCSESDWNDYWASGDQLSFMG